MEKEDLEKVAKRLEIDGKILNDYSTNDLQLIAAELMATVNDTTDLPVDRIELYRKIVSIVVKKVADGEGKRVENGHALEVGRGLIDRTEIGEFWSDLKSL